MRAIRESTAELRALYEQVVAVMNRLSTVRGARRRIRVDNGPEFVSRALDQWAYLNQVTLDFSRPGKPTDNAMGGVLQRTAQRRVSECQSVPFA